MFTYIVKQVLMYVRMMVYIPAISRNLTLTAHTVYGRKWWEKREKLTCIRQREVMAVVRLHLPAYRGLCSLPMAAIYYLGKLLIQILYKNTD